MNNRQKVATLIALLLLSILFLKCTKEEIYKEPECLCSVFHINSDGVANGVSTYTSTCVELLNDGFSPGIGEGYSVRYETKCE